MIKSKIKYILIIAMCSFICTMLHGALSILFPVTIPTEFSIIAKTIGMPLTSFLYFVFAYGCISYVFYRYENRLSGTPFQKGLVFGVATGIIWLWGMLENISLFGTRLIDEFMTGLSDFLPIVLLCLMIAMFCFKKEKNIQMMNRLKHKSILIPTLIFSVIFCIGRYLSYTTNLLLSGYRERPYLTLIWTLGMGVIIAFTRHLLRDSIVSGSAIKNALIFGITIFGVNWFVFNAFIPFFLDVSIFEMIIRVCIDIVLVILCCFATNTLENKLK